MLLEIRDIMMTITFPQAYMSFKEKMEGKRFGVFMPTNKKYDIRNLLDFGC